MCWLPCLLGGGGWGEAEVFRVSRARVCVCVHACARTQSYLTLCNPMACRLPGFSVRGILQARTLRWIARPSSRGSSLPRDGTCISTPLALAGGFFTSSALGKPTASNSHLLNDLVFLPGRKRMSPTSHCRCPSASPQLHQRSQRPCLSLPSFLTTNAKPSMVMAVPLPSNSGELPSMCRTHKFLLIPQVSAWKLLP